MIATTGSFAECPRPGAAVHSSAQWALPLRVTVLPLAPRSGVQAARATPGKRALRHGDWRQQTRGGLGAGAGVGSEPEQGLGGGGLSQNERKNQ